MEKRTRVTAVVGAVCAGGLGTSVAGWHQEAAGTWADQSHPSELQRCPACQRGCSQLSTARSTSISKENPHPQSKHFKEKL